jgi:hypothetical protein
MSASKLDKSWIEISAPEQALEISIRGLCCERTEIDASPIDDFYEYISLLIPIGTIDQLAANNALGRALLLGIVSGTELYFRSILSTLINVCPVARNHASSQQLSLGAVDYYRLHLGFGLLENVSIAGSGEIYKQTRRITGIELPKGSSVQQAVLEFEKLCELRHAATHSRGDLGHQNVRDLGLEHRGKRFALQVNLQGLHEATGVCQNLVRAYNRFLYRQTIERWIAERVLYSQWSRDGKKFLALHQLFKSTRDHVGPDSAREAYTLLQPTLKIALARATAEQVGNRLKNRRIGA